MNHNFLTAKDAMASYVHENYMKTQDEGTRLFKQMLEGSAKGPLCINVLKQYYNEKSGDFHLLGRILSGTISKGQSVRVLGEKYTSEEQEDMVVNKVKALYLAQQGGRYKIEVD